MSASRCRFCDVTHTSGGAAREHLLGRSHQRKVADQPPATGDAALRSVALKGPSSFYDANPSPVEIFQRLETSGKIVDFRLRTRPDKTLVRGAAIHVEFETTCEAETLLSGGILIAGHEMELSRPRANGRPGPHPRQDTSEAVQHEALLSWLRRQRSRSADELMAWLAGQLLLTPAEHEQRVRFCRELQAELRVRFRTCLVQAFGSSVSGLGFHGCDLDLYAYVDADAPDAGLPADADETDRARAVASVLQAMRRPDLCSRLVRILQARVPIIKFCAKRLGGVHCDMSFRSPMSCQNSRLVGWFMEADQRARLVAVVLRYWANRHHVAGGDHNPRKMSSYCITMLVITFLQQLDPPVLPSVAWLQAQVPEVLIGPWNAAFALDASWRSANQSTAGGLLRDFFRYGADLQSERLAVCPLLGRAVPREQLADGQDCHVPELRRYFSLVVDLQVAPLDTGTALVVQDPFELDFNVARNYSQEGLDRFRECCARAVTMPFHELFEEEPLTKARGKKAPPAGAGRTDGGAEAVSRKRERLVSGDACAEEAGTKVPRSAESPEAARQGRSVESARERGALGSARGEVDAEREESGDAERVSGLVKGNGVQLLQKGDSDAKGVMRDSVGDKESPSGVNGTGVEEAMTTRVDGAGDVALRAGGRGRAVASTSGSVPGTPLGGAARGVVASRAPDSDSRTASDAPHGADMAVSAAASDGSEAAAGARKRKTGAALPEGGRVSAVPAPASGTCSDEANASSTAVATGMETSLTPNGDAAASGPAEASSATPPSPELPPVPEAVRLHADHALLKRVLADFDAPPSRVVSVPLTRGGRAPTEPAETRRFAGAFARFLYDLLRRVLLFDCVAMSFVELDVSLDVVQGFSCHVHLPTWEYRKKAAGQLVGRESDVDFEVKVTHMALKLQSSPERTPLASFTCYLVLEGTTANVCFYPGTTVTAGKNCHTFVPAFVSELSRKVDYVKLYGS